MLFIVALKSLNQIFTVYKKDNIRVQFLGVLLIFCLKSFISVGQGIGDEKLLNTIQSNISAGYLTKASEENDKLKQQNPSPSSFYNKMSKLLSVRISGLGGDYKSMHELLNEVDRNDDDPIIQFYWKDYFARYCLESDKFKIGVDALQESIELANSIGSNIRIDIQKHISEFIESQIWDLMAIAVEPVYHFRCHYVVMSCVMACGKEFYTVLYEMTIKSHK